MRTWGVLLPILLAGGCAVPQHSFANVEFQRLGDAEHVILGLHNRERARFGSPPLQWDPYLAAEAKNWAARVAARGRLFHSRHRDRPGQGENMWMGTRGYFSARTMVSQWASERRHFRPGSVGNFSRTGQFRDVGHYTQMVWPTTTRVGCGIASSAQWDVLVCRYTPAGNVTGVQIGN